MAVAYAPERARAPCPPSAPRRGGSGAVRVPAASGELRPEIQALRALAVLLVVGYHFWPSAVPAGYIGVDVFFAISGFLITSLLLRELERTGRISLPRFWARRVRRLLPAAFSVLLFVVVMTVLFVPLPHWEQWFGEIRASTLYVQNWHVADAAVDYFAADDAPSAVLHFWTLSAEEQFYFVWPIVLLVAGSLVARRSAIVFALIAVTAVSFAWSVDQTAGNPAAAYFVTPARAWEFGAGGLLALLSQEERSPAALRSALSWLGLLAIFVAAFTYSDSTPFPGTAALLPIAGALAVIRAGAPRARFAPTPALRLPPVQFVGNVSYAVYLWHWPLLILAPFVLGTTPGTPVLVVILMLTILASWLSKILVEDPVREGSFLTRRRPRWSFGFALFGGAIVLAAAAGGFAHLNERVRADERATRALVASQPACFGAAARDPEQPCANPALRRTVVPTPIEARRQPNAPCTFLSADKFLCEFGVRRQRANGTVAVIGDSHAGHWRGAVEVVAKARGWYGLAVIQSGCQFSAAVKALPEPRRSGCVRWRKRVLRWLEAHPEVKAIFQSQVAGGTNVITSRRDKFAAAVDGYVAMWSALPNSVEHVVVLRDTPSMRGSTAACVQEALDKRRRLDVACAVPRASAVERDPLFFAASRATGPAVHAVDLTDHFCDAKDCYPVVGGALVHKDVGHLTGIFSSTLGPYLQRQVDRVMPAA